MHCCTETALKERRMHLFPFSSCLLDGAAWILCFILLIQLLSFPVDRFRVLLILPRVLTVRRHRADAFEEERKPSLGL